MKIRAESLCIILELKFFEFQHVIVSWSLRYYVPTIKETVCITGPAEYGGTVGIRPNHLLPATLNLFQLWGGGADSAHNIKMSQPNF